MEAVFACKALRGDPLLSASYNEVVRVADFDYNLPAERIAQRPLADRAASRMLVVDRATGRWEDRTFRDFPSCLQEGDRLVLNDSKVLPARLFGRRSGVQSTRGEKGVSGLVEVLLLRQVSSRPMRWEALVRPGRKMRVGERIHFAGGLDAAIVERGRLGLRVVEFDSPDGFFETLERTGHTPLPPYIKRSDDEEDRRRYQTVYAKRAGSVAAPTAGLHFTPEILRQVEQRGAERVEITLHVGLGTFQPVHVQNVEEHEMHSETYEITPQASEHLNGSQRIIAVGTSTVRALEHAVSLGCGRFKPISAENSLFIYPGFAFRAVDCLLTNFHLPCSTLLMLVCAFAGRDLVLRAYEHAVKEKYRFYSYGDCMLIV